MSLKDLIEHRNKFISGELELFRVDIFIGSIFSTEAEEWINRIRRCHNIIGCLEDPKITLGESILQEMLGNGKYN